MGILQSIKARFARKYAVSPLTQALQQHCQEFFYSGSLLSDTRESIKQHHIAELQYGLQATMEAENPAAFLRETVGGFILHYAPLQALALREEEKPHVGFGANPHISGALHRDIAHLSQFVDSLKSLEPKERTQQSWIATCNGMCVLDLFYINGLNIIRHDLGDVSDPDWFNPLVEAMIVRAENDIRGAAGMPLTVKESLDTVCYGNMNFYMMMRVLNPYEMWCRNYPDLFLAGRGDPMAKRPEEEEDCF